MVQSQEGGKSVVWILLVCTTTLVNMASFLCVTRKCTWVQNPLTVFKGKGLSNVRFYLPGNYHPVFPFKRNSKLMFPLCSACIDTMNQGNCTHWRRTVYSWNMCSGWRCRWRRDGFWFGGRVGILGLFCNAFGQSYQLGRQRQRTLAKLKLNSVWVKWAQNQNKTQTTLVTPVKEFHEHLRSPVTEVTNLIFLNDEVAWVFWKYSENNVAAGKKTRQLLPT